MFRFGEYRSSGAGRAGTAIGMLFIGLGIGAAVALLYAPKTGRQMRKTLRRRVEDARDTMQDWSDQANEVLDRGTEWASNARGKVAPIARRFGRQF
ncbi:MAG TPA: YtxH domain-containing protein [Candidatus Acidoferrales bacterium]|nr:YtxH domain-containing protein [Candidatus Acidoferrales bacterium]